MPRWAPARAGSRCPHHLAQGHRWDGEEGCDEAALIRGFIRVTPFAGRGDPDCVRVLYHYEIS